jgi:hypothetical protein
MLAGQIGARGQICTDTGDALDVVALWWPPAKAWATRAEGTPPAGLDYRLGSAERNLSSYARSEVKNGRRAG